jgi:hypothetical protein
MCAGDLGRVIDFCNDEGGIDDEISQSPRPDSQRSQATLAFLAFVCFVFLPPSIMVFIRALLASSLLVVPAFAQLSSLTTGLSTACQSSATQLLTSNFVSPPGTRQRGLS